MLKFDAETARILEIAYVGADATRRRQATFDALGPRPGDRVVDIGCGNGLLTLELARAVGPEGRVYGIDPSGEMRALAVDRTAAFPTVEISEGLADALPLDDGSVEGAVALQVFEYLPDIPAALREARRVLVPGGRLVVGDAHWDTLAWESDDPERMARMLAAWDGHLAEGRVPALLPGMLGNAGFALEAVTPFSICDAVLRPDGIPNMLLHLVEAYVVETGRIAAAEARAWGEEQRRMAREGRFFCTITYAMIAARAV